jgi:hypothetical protein
MHLFPGPLFKKALSDSNAAAQEKALDALIAFLQHTDADSGRQVGPAYTIDVEVVMSLGP